MTAENSGSTARRVAAGSAGPASGLGAASARPRGDCSGLAACGDATERGVAEALGLKRWAASSGARQTGCRYGESGPAWDLGLEDWDWDGMALWYQYKGEATGLWGGFDLRDVGDGRS